MSSVVIQHEDGDVRSHLEVKVSSKNNRQQGPVVRINAGRSARVDLPEGGKLSVAEVQGLQPTAGSFTAEEPSASPQREGRETAPTRDSEFESS